MRSAEIVRCTVSSHPDDVTIQVSYGGRTVDVGVLDAAAYPVGSQVAVATDPAGLHQLRSEAYDATSWDILAASLLVFGGAVLWRLLGAARAPLPQTGRPARPDSATREIDATGWPVLAWYEIVTIATIVRIRNACGWSLDAAGSLGETTSPTVHSELA